MFTRRAAILTLAAVALVPMLSYPTNSTAVEPELMRLISKGSFRIMVIAGIEARLEYCGIRLDLERRVTVAVKNCVPADALERGLSLFRKSKVDGAKEVVKQVADKRFPGCASDEERKFQKEVSGTLDNTVNQFARTCATRGLIGLLDDLRRAGVTSY
jgi:hypothetical protein